MARGRPRIDPDKLVRKPYQGIRAPYNVKQEEKRGKQGKEPVVIKSFWKEYTMDQVMAMSDEEILEAIDKSLDNFEIRQHKHNKSWNWPIEKKMLDIDPEWKK